MNRELIYDALLQPEKLKMIPREELERVAAEYPYFNPAQVLLARIYQSEGDHRFSDQLLSASNTAGDRVSLYHFLKHTEVQQGSNITEIRQEEPVQEAVPVVVNMVAPVVAPTVHTDLTDAASAEAVVELPETKPSSADIPPVIESRLSADEEEEDTEHELLPEDLLDREVLLRAVYSTIEQDVLDDLRGKRSEPIEEPETKEKQVVSVAEPSLEESEEEATESSDPFANYLMRRAREIGYEEEPSESTDLKTNPGAEEDEEEETDQDNIDAESTKKPDTTSRVAGPPLGLSGSRKRNQQELIDRFIQTNPRITPGRSDDYDVDSIARTSVTDDLSLVSETMAELLASQGKKEKARKVYRKLMELHPEKSIYFAARLKNLDKLK